MGKARKREQIDVWRFDDLAGVELRSGVAVTEPYPRHWHEEYQFCFIQAGGGELFYRGVHHHTPSISLFIVHPGEVHSNQTQTDCSFRSIYIEPEFIRQTVFGWSGEHRRQLPFFPNPMVFDREIMTDYLFFHLLENSSTTLERQSAILEMLVKLLTRHAQEKPGMKAAGRENSAVKKAREYILAHHERNISLEELARVSNLSNFHLTRVFTKEVGMPPHAFQTQTRIAKAKKLIRDGLPLSEIALLTGFADQSHFIRHFKRLLKITPGEYFKNSKNVQYEIQ